MIAGWWWRGGTHPWTGSHRPGACTAPPPPPPPATPRLPSSGTRTNLCQPQSCEIPILIWENSLIMTFYFSSFGVNKLSKFMFYCEMLFHWIRMDHHYIYVRDKYCFDTVSSVYSCTTWLNCDENISALSKTCQPSEIWNQTWSNSC